jgi:hypothetical protein
MSNHRIQSAVCLAKAAKPSDDGGWYDLVRGKLVDVVLDNWDDVSDSHEGMRSLLCRIANKCGDTDGYQMYDRREIREEILQFFADNPKSNR